MDEVTISRSEYERFKHAVKKLKMLEEIDFELVRQFKESLEDVKYGRIKRVA